MKAKNMTIDKLSIFMYTRKLEEGASEDDGSAEIVVRIIKQLICLSFYCVPK